MTDNAQPEIITLDPKLVQALQTVQEIVREEICAKQRIKAAKANTPNLHNFIWNDNWFVADPERAYMACMTDRLSLMIDDVIPPNSTESCGAEELICIHFTDSGIVFTLNSKLCKGQIIDPDNNQPVILHGSRAALEAAGATNIE